VVFRGEQKSASETWAVAFGGTNALLDTLLLPVRTSALYLQETTEHTKTCHKDSSMNVRLRNRVVRTGGAGLFFRIRWLLYSSCFGACWPGLCVSGTGSLLFQILVYASFGP
jgi:hypothetical protein